MAVEREPPKSPAKSGQQTSPSAHRPVFGETSGLRSPLRAAAAIFNIPRHNKSRPEHHREDPRSTSATFKDSPDLKAPVTMGSTNANPKPASGTTQNPYVLPSVENSPDLMEIRKPPPPPTWSTQPIALAMYSSNYAAGGGFASVNHSTNAWGGHRSGSNLDDFDPYDPSNYMDSGKATDDIKALLEGAFEDEDDKPRTRGKKKKIQEKTNELVDKMKSLGIETDKSLEDESIVEEEEEDDGTVEGMKVKLLPHQVDGIEWMRQKETGSKKIKGSLPKGGILADDMGLGKTIQAIALILTNPRQPVIPTSESNSKQEKGKLSNKVGKGTLVVAPLALIKQWEGEIKNRVKDSHSLRVCIHHGPQRTKRFEDLRKYDVVITTYNILVSEYGSSSVKEDAPQVGCFGIHWYRVILDEAHSIKNRNAKSAKAAYALRSEYRWCLTGTPMQNNLDELQSLIKFLRIKPYDELSVWKDQITRPLSQGKGGLAMKRLQTYLKVFMKRRTKDILKAEGALNPGGKPTKDGSVSQGFRITERVVEKIEVGFTPSERAYYERLEKRTDKSLERMMKDDGLSYMGALTLLLRLRQACNHSQLVKKSLTTDKDAITTGQVPGSQSAKKQTVTNGDVDEMADLLGGLSMESKQCDVCLIKLSKEEASSGMVRCTECEQDLADQEGANESRKNKKDKRRKEKAKARSKPKSKSRSEPKPSSDVRKNRTRQIIDDSDDGGEGEGEWLVGQDQQQGPNLGKAGGTEDEHAEGGGEWLASDDSETDDEVSVNVTSVSRKKTIRSSGSDTDSEEEEESFQSVDSSRSEATVEEDDDDEDDESDDDESEDSDASVVTHLAISTKIKHLIRILNAETPSHKFIVFSQFTSMLDLIEPFLKSANLKFTRYDGGMKNDLREASLERLRTDKNTRILLCSLKCGSLGLNLTAASRVVILEPFWNPFVEEQAIDRVHRLNQTVDVHVYKLTIANTVEERIFDLQEKKRALADAAIEGKGAAKLSMKDMLALFRRDAEHDMKHDAKHAELGTKTRVLGGISTSTPSRQDSMNSTGSVGARGVGYSQRVTPPIMERMMPNKPKEDSVYGRRW